jgi:hypothetical protein
MFLLATAPATAMIVLAGGLAGFAPVLFLLVGLVIAGRLPGEEALARLIERRSPKHASAPKRSPRPRSATAFHPLRSLLIASALAERGPPRTLAHLT